MSRPSRNGIYNAVTSKLGKEVFKEVLGSTAALTDDGNVVDCLTQGLFVYGLHQQLSRSYYVNIFGQSHDAQAFLEYTYHHLSALRYLTKVISILKAEDLVHESTISKSILCMKQFVLSLMNNADRAAFNQLSQTELDRIETDGVDKFLESLDIDSPNPTFDAIKRFRELCRQLYIRNGTVYAKAVILGTVSKALRDALLTEFKERHAHEVTALNRAWMRHDQLLRHQISAQHLLTWTRQILEDDLLYRLDRVVIGYANSTPICHPDSTKDGLCSKTQLADLKDTLESLQVKVWSERGDYLRVLDIRSEQLDINCQIDSIIQLRTPDNVDMWIVDYVKPTLCEQVKVKLDKPAAFHAAIDLVNVIVKRAQSHPFRCKVDSKTPDDLRDDFLTVAKALLETIIKKAEQLQPNHGSGEDATLFHEALLRSYYLLAECQWNSLSVFRYSEKPGILLPSASVENRSRIKGYETRMRDALNAIDKGMYENRRQMHGTSRSPNSVFLDRASDGSFYTQYSTAFDGLRARAQWQLDLCLFQKNHPDPSVDDAKLLQKLMQRAFRYFELARSGQDDNNPLLGAVAEIYMAEACMGIALFQRRLAEKFGKPDDTELMHLESLSKLEAARGCLQRASRLLTQSRRNAMWWRLFYTMVAQYQRERLAAIPDSNTQSARNSPERIGLPDIISRLRRGYNAVANAARYRTDFVTNESWLFDIAKGITTIAMTKIKDYLAGLKYASAKLEKHQQIALKILQQLHSWEGLNVKEAVGEVFAFNDLSRISDLSFSGGGGAPTA